MSFTFKSLPTIFLVITLFFLMIQVEISAVHGGRSYHARARRYDDWRYYYWQRNAPNWPSYYDYYRYPLYGSTYQYSYPLYSTYQASYPSYYTNYSYPSYPYNGTVYINQNPFAVRRSYPLYRKRFVERNVIVPLPPQRGRSGVFLKG